MTTQSPHLYTRRHGAGSPAARTAAVQTRLPWWALVLPAAAFVALLALITGGPAHASTPSVGVDTLGRIAAVLGPLVHHMP